MSTDVIQILTEFGAAGLIGVLWLFERSLSRRRERELTEAHTRVLRDGEQIQILIRLLRQNTHAIERFDATQTRLAATLDQLDKHVRQHAA